LSITELTVVFLTYWNMLFEDRLSFGQVTAS